MRHQMQRALLLALTNWPLRAIHIETGTRNSVSARPTQQHVSSRWADFSAGKKAARNTTLSVPREWSVPSTGRPVAKILISRRRGSAHPNRLNDGWVRGCGS